MTPPPQRTPCRPTATPPMAAARSRSLRTALSTSDLEVEGADSAYEATVENEGESYSTAGMAYGNTVIMVVDTGQYEGDPAPDNSALLEEVATALSEG